MTLIVDSQVHIWRGVRPGMEKMAGGHRPSPFAAPELLPLMREAGVAGAVLAPANWDPTRNQTAIDAAREHPGRFVVMGILGSLENLSEQLAGWRDQGMHGLRIATRNEPYATWLETRAVEELWTEAEAIGLRVMSYGPGSRLQVLGESARQHPGLDLTLDHMGFSPPHREVDIPNEEQIEHLLALAKLPNVKVKLSALPVFSREEFPFRDMFDPVRRVIDAFGPERCFFGTDLSRQRCTYQQAVESMQMIIQDLDPGEQDLVMGAAISRWLAWTPAEP